MNGSNLLGCPVLSLHTTEPLGVVIQEIVDPNSLSITAFFLDGPEIGDGETGDILETRSIREFSRIGMIIDSSDELISDGDVIKLDEIIKLNFNLPGLKVVTKKGTNLGKIVDFTVDTDTFKVLQLVVKRPRLKGFIDPELIIPRSEIVEITDYEIIVKDEEDKIKKRAAKEDFIPNFVNPFRENNLAQAKNLNDNTNNSWYD